MVWFDKLYHNKNKNKILKNYFFNFLILQAKYKLFNWKKNSKNRNWSARKEHLMTNKNATAKLNNKLVSVKFQRKKKRWHSLTRLAPVLEFEHEDAVECHPVLFELVNVYLVCIRVAPRVVASLKRVWSCDTDSYTRLDRWTPRKCPQGRLQRCSFSFFLYATSLWYDN